LIHLQLVKDLNIDLSRKNEALKLRPDCTQLNLKLGLTCNFYGCRKTSPRKCIFRLELMHALIPLGASFGQI